MTKTDTLRKGFEEWCVNRPYPLSVERIEDDSEHYADGVVSQMWNAAQFGLQAAQPTEAEIEGLARELEDEAEEAAEAGALISKERFAKVLRGKLGGTTK